MHRLLEFLARNERLRFLHGGKFVGHSDVIRVICGLVYGLRLYSLRTAFAF